MSKEPYFPANIPHTVKETMEGEKTVKRQRGIDQSKTMFLDQSGERLAL